MEQGTIWINQHAMIIIGILSVIIVILLVLVIKCQNQVNKLQRKYDFFLEGDEVKIGELLTKTLEKIHQDEECIVILQDNQKKMREQLSGCLQNVKMERYDAFDAMGGELSYSILIEDENKNGLILTSIYGRDESRSYAKLVKNGKTSTPLAEEEKKLL